MLYQHKTYGKWENYLFSSNTNNGEIAKRNITHQSPGQLT